MLEITNLSLTGILTPREVKQILKCSLPYVYKSASNGTLPCIRIPCPGSGKKQKSLVRFKTQDIFDFIEKHYRTIRT